MGGYIELDSSNEIVPVTPESLDNHGRGTLDVSEYTSDNSLSSEIPLQDTILLLRPDNEQEMQQDGSDGGDAATASTQMRFGFINTSNASGQILEQPAGETVQQDVMNEYIDETQFGQQIQAAEAAAAAANTQPTTSSTSDESYDQR